MASENLINFKKYSVNGRPLKCGRWFVEPDLGQERRVFQGHCKEIGQGLKLAEYSHELRKRSDQVAQKISVNQNALNKISSAKSVWNNKELWLMYDEAYQKAFNERMILPNRFNTIRQKRLDHWDENKDARIKNLNQEQKKLTGNLEGLKKQLDEFETRLRNIQSSLDTIAGCFGAECEWLADFKPVMKSGVRLPEGSVVKLVLHGGSTLNLNLHYRRLTADR